MKSNSSVLLPIDMEYNSSSEPKLNLVCASFEYNNTIENFWIYHSPKEYGRLKSRLLEIRSIEGDRLVLLAYNVIAEARSFLALDLSPFLFNWVDLYLFYRMLTNHNHRFMYGKQIIKGKKKVTRSPLKNKYQMTEEEKKRHNFSKPEHNLVAACYKVLGKTIDNDFKNENRDLILANKGEYSADERTQITNYCASDIKYLIPLFKGLIAEYKRLIGPSFNMDELKDTLNSQANYAIESAYMEQRGYPVNMETLTNFSSSLPTILWECQNDINRNLGVPLFRYTSKKNRLAMIYSMDQGIAKDMVRAWCKENNKKDWTLTDTEDISLSLDAFTKFISYSHTYPEGNFIAQMQRYLKLKQSVNGFSVSAKNTIFDSIGSDGRVRPYMGIYGSQSSRSQPKATSFIPLKAAWMRAMIEPKEGRVCIGIDYASQEFLLAALVSKDERMMKAYESGDVYLSFGKDINYIPATATKKSHKKERDNCKAVVLGLSYDMSEYGLSYDLSEKFGRKVSTDEALGWINKHKRAYTDFWEYKERSQKEYKYNGRLSLGDGWTLWGDNQNHRSVGNFPIQGLGACIMRKAVELASWRGLEVIYTLHDAIYIESDDIMSVQAASKLCECMDEAFRFYFPEELKDRATCRLDVDIWGPTMEDGETGMIGYDSMLWQELTAPYKMQKIYIDERALADYERFKPYMFPSKEEEGEGDLSWL